MPHKQNESGPDIPKKRNRSTTSTVAILAAAKSLFLEFGYDGVNLEKVAEAAGVSRQTVYNRFGSKEAVFQAMIESHWKMIGQNDVQGADGNASSAQTVLRKFGESIIAFVDQADQIAFTRLIISESRRLPWIAEEFYRVGKKPLVTSFTDRLRQLTRQGLVDCEDPEFAAHQFMGLIQEFAIWPRVMAIGSDAEQLAQRQDVVDEAVKMFMARYQRLKPDRRS